MTKSEARERIRTMRRRLDQTYIDQASEAITERLIDRFRDQRLDHCLLYSALPGEVDVHRLRDRLPDTSIYYPRVKGQEIEIVPYSSTEGFVMGNFKVWEPVGEAMPQTFEPNAIVVPGVAFDRQRNRVGYGKGFYDRLLARCPSSRTIGVCFSFQLFDHLDDTSAWDIAMGEIVTEEEEFPPFNTPST